MSHSAAEKIVWGIGALALVLVLIAPAERLAGPETWMASLGYLIGFHWIVAYFFGRPMYGALRLQPAHRVGRAVVLVLGIALVAVALQFLLGFGGPFA